MVAAWLVGYCFAHTKSPRTCSDWSEISRCPRKPRACEPEAKLSIPISTEMSTSGIHIVTVWGVSIGQ